MDIDFMPNNKYAAETSSDRVYTTLRDSILQLKLAPGASINESTVATMLNVSRTPVREAFIRLNIDRLIISYPQRGSVVTRIDLELVREGMFMRKCLEHSVYLDALRNPPPGLIVDLKRLVYMQETIPPDDPEYKVEFMKYDNQFHQRLFESQGKANIWESILSLNTHLNRLRYMELTANLNIPIILDQHKRIIEAIEKQDEDALSSLIDHHMENVLVVVDTLKQKYPDAFLKQ